MFWRWDRNHHSFDFVLGLEITTCTFVLGLDMHPALCVYMVYCNPMWTIRQNSTRIGNWCLARAINKIKMPKASSHCCSTLEMRYLIGIIIISNYLLKYSNSCTFLEVVVYKIYFGFVLLIKDVVLNRIPQIDQLNGIYDIRWTLFTANGPSDGQ